MPINIEEENFMKKIFIFSLVGVFSFLVLTAPNFLYGQKKKKVFPADKGPKKIEASILSTYPAEMQTAYKLFAKKCSKCHTIARPINTNMKLEDWERYTKRMMRKPNSNISKEERETIYKFLEYDQINRKDKESDKFFKPVTMEEESSAETEKE